MSESMQLAIASTLANAAVTWGTIRVTLAWLRRDVDELRQSFRHLRCVNNGRPLPCDTDQ